MGSKHYLNVTITPRSTLSENKQKSCESYDSTSSNYSQISENSDISVNNSTINNNNPKPYSAFSTPDDSTYFDFSSNEAQVKRTIWQKAVSSFRGYKDKKKYGTSPSRSPRMSECQEIDPVYHLLKCAAGQTKCSKCMEGEMSKRSSAISLGREKSLPGIHLDIYKGSCNDPTCPCNEPNRLPVVKKEDLGQQAKREQSIKKCASVSPRQSAMTSRSSSVTATFARY